MTAVSGCCQLARVLHVHGIPAVVCEAESSPAARADDGTGGRPEVQRGELRRMLLDALPPGTVR